MMSKHKARDGLDLRKGVNVKSLNKRREKLVQECRDKLLSIKSELLNRIREQKKAFLTRPQLVGDEADQTFSIIEEQNLLLSQERTQRMLMEIDGALERIVRGTFGVCEETEEFIEPDRLRLIPWTTLSIEGAEIRDARKKFYAK
jgi:DnaK suppressor protein